MTYSTVELKRRFKWNAVVARQLTVGSCIAFGTLHFPASSSVPLNMSASSEGSVNITVSVRPTFNVRRVPNAQGGDRYCMASNARAFSVMPRLRVEQVTDAALRSSPTYLLTEACHDLGKIRRAISSTLPKMIIVEAQ